MSDIEKIDVMIFRTTPETLRFLADEMEKQWNECMVGDSTMVAKIGYNPRIELHYDQSMMGKKVI